MTVKASPNKFDLRGERVEVHYSTTSITGQPLLSGEIDGRKVSLSGDAIAVQESPIGFLVTVTTLPSDRAGRQFQFSMILPGFRGGEGTFEFTTVGILTTNLEGDVNPQDGALSTYQAVTLTGTAQTVQF